MMIVPLNCPRCSKPPAVRLEQNTTMPLQWEVGCDTCTVDDDGHWFGTTSRNAYRGPALTESDRDEAIVEWNELVS